MSRRITLVPAPPPLNRQPLPPSSQVSRVHRPWTSDARDGFFDAPPGWVLLAESSAVARAFFIAVIVLGAVLAKLFLPWQKTALLTLTFIVPSALALATLLWLTLVLYRALWFERRERRYMLWLDYHLDRLIAEQDTEEPQRAVTNVRDTRYWDQLAFVILQRYYYTLTQTGSREAAARAISRDVCVSAGLCNQKEWNVVNRLLVARGLRRGRKRGLTPHSLDEAWRIWQQKSAEVSGWYIDEHGDWIPRE